MSAQALPVEYTPMSLTNIRKANSYDDVIFAVKEKSHQKTVAGLLGSLEPGARGDWYDDRTLLPSEQWGFARVLCRTFGRLNEVALGASQWELYRFASIGDTLRSRTWITGTSSRRGLAFMDAVTETFHDPSGFLLQRCHDRLILTHDCTKPFFAEPKPVAPALPDGLLYDNKHTVYHRYPWDPGVWQNNIHVDEYAQLCGFAGALPEFVTYMDWVFHVAKCSRTSIDRPFTIKLQKVLPMYLGESMRLVSWQDDNRLQVRFLKGEMERVIARVAPLPADNAGDHHATFVRPAAPSVPA